ncbi:MAG: hypothetical protein RQ729_08720 [Wenzhouxiangellaceae bacterium]|nr:hypothetical protein [Wenzhouxiangellaceae bacterium]
MSTESNPAAAPRGLSAAVLASVAVHAAMLLALAALPGTAPPVPDSMSDSSSIRMRLVATPPSPSAATEPEPRPRPLEPATEPAALSAASQTSPYPQSDREPSPASAPNPDATEQSSDDPQLAARLRAAVADLRLPRTTADASSAPHAGRNQAAPLPRRPGAPGLLSRATAPVTPSEQRWNNADGSAQARHVLADGRVICTRRRPPTAEELAHPWKSTRVTMAGLCGRERPSPIELEPLQQRRLPRPAGRMPD